MIRIGIITFLLTVLRMTVFAQSTVIELGTDTVYYDKEREYTAAIDMERYMESYVFYARALELYQAADYFGANARISKAVKMNRSETEFRLLQAWILSRDQSYKKAIKACNRILDDRPGHQEAMYCKALNQFLLGDIDGSIRTYSTLLVEHPGDHRALFGRAEAKAKAEDLRGAIADYSAALMLEPTLFLANEGRGMVYFKLFEYHMAIMDFNQFLVANPESGRVFYFRGMAYLRLSDYANACRDMQQADRLHYREARGFLEKNCGY